jgi:hypothetical protein
MLRQKRQHLVDDRGIELRRRVVIEVNGYVVRHGLHSRDRGARCNVVPRDRRFVDSANSVQITIAHTGANAALACYRRRAGNWKRIFSLRATTASVHHGRRQELEVADLEFAVFFDKNDLEIEVEIKILVLLQLLHADALCLGHLFKFLR